MPFSTKINKVFVIQSNYKGNQTSDLTFLSQLKNMLLCHLFFLLQVIDVL